MDRACQCLVVCLIAGLGVVSCTVAPDLDSGSVVPSALVELGIADSSPTSGTTYVVWVVDAKACLSCGTPDYVLRRLVGRESTQLQVLHVGDATDRGLVRSYLRERRLPMLAATMSVTGARRAFGARDIPFLVVMRADTIRWIGAVEDLNLDRGSLAGSTRLGK